VNAASASARAFAWTGAALFVLSLGYFLYTYLVTFAEMVSGRLSTAAVAANVSLFSVFALHHSVFARESVRAWMARQLSPAVERACYVWVASLMLVAVCALWQPLPGVAWDVRPPAAWLLRAIQVFGVWLSLRSAAVIDVWDLSGVRQARATSNRQLPTPRKHGTGSSDSESAIGDWEFRTDGPYGWVRHPIYLGWFLIVFAMPRMTMTQLLFAVVSSVYVLIAIPFEERSLMRTSGGTYQRYRQQVPWKLVPRLY
jgi:protein-S-isoprenylcysteine O-methyltransferase Ste14